MLHGCVEAEAGEDAGGPARRRMRMNFAEPGLDFGEAQRLGARLPLGQEARALVIGGEHGRQRSRRSTWRFLGKKADAVFVRQLDRAVLGQQNAANQIEQGRFADAVAADQPDLGAVVDLGTRALEQPPSADAVNHIRKGQHLRPLP